MTLPPSVRVAPTCNTSPLGLEVVSALNDFFSLDCFHDVDLGSISPVYETIPRKLSEGCGLLLLLLLLLLVVVVVLVVVWRSARRLILPLTQTNQLVLLLLDLLVLLLQQERRRDRRRYG